jgi:hypothetical protein
MAIQSQLRRSDIYVGDGVQTQFSFSFKLLKSEDAEVHVAPPHGVDAVLNPNAYVCVLNDDQDVNPGGKITLKEPLVKGAALAVISGEAYVQPTVFTNRGAFFPTVLNDSLDRLTILCQQLVEQVNRALITDPTDTITPRQLRDKLLEATASALDAAAKALQSETNAAASAATSKEYADKLLAFKDQIVTVSENIKSVGVTAENAEAIAAIAKNLEELLKSKDYAAEAKGWAEQANAITGGQSLIMPGGTSPLPVLDWLAAKPHVFKSVADMKVAKFLAPGMTAVTQGYYEPGDGGGAVYRIVESTEKFSEELLGGLLAELLIYGDTVSVDQFGAVGDGVTDDRQAIQLAVDSDAGVVKFSSRSYLVSDAVINKKSNKVFDFGGADIIAENNTHIFVCGDTNVTYDRANLSKSVAVRSTRIFEFKRSAGNRYQIPVFGITSITVTNVYIKDRELSSDEYAVDYNPTFHDSDSNTDFTCNNPVVTVSATVAYGESVVITVSCLAADTNHDLFLTEEKENAGYKLAAIVDKNTNIDTSRKYYKRGELLRVNEIDGNELKLIDTLTLPFDKDSSDILLFKNTLSNIRVIGGRFSTKLKTEVVELLVFSNVVDLTIDGVRFADANPYIALSTNLCHGVSIDGATVVNNGGNVRYGIVSFGCKNIYVKQTNAQCVWHCFASGGARFLLDGTLVSINSDNVFIDRCVFKSYSGKYSCDSHGDVLKMSVTNSVLDGLSMGAKVITLSDNQIIGQTGYHFAASDIHSIRICNSTNVKRYVDRSDQNTPGFLIGAKYIGNMTIVNSDVPGFVFWESSYINALYISDSRVFWWFNSGNVISNTGKILKLNNCAISPAPYAKYYGTAFEEISITNSFVGAVPCAESGELGPLYIRPVLTRVINIENNCFDSAGPSDNSGSEFAAYLSIYFLHDAPCKCLVRIRGNSFLNESRRGNSADNTKAGVIHVVSVLNKNIETSQVAIDIDSNRFDVQNLDGASEFFHVFVGKKATNTKILSNSNNLDFEGAEALSKIQTWS